MRTKRKPTGSQDGHVSVFSCPSTKDEENPPKALLYFYLSINLTCTPSKARVNEWYLPNTIGTESTGRWDHHDLMENQPNSLLEVD